MLGNRIEFTELEQELLKVGRTHLDYLAPGVGKACVVSITRDNCSACRKQKPKLIRLTENSLRKYGSKVSFIQIHVRQPDGSQEESLRSKELLGHYFYPTNIILLRTAEGKVIEYYKNASPRISELEYNIESAVRIAEILGKEET